jgi:murein DD-endopeptidase MepM/ murein hydrolase activator NlpD
MDDGVVAMVGRNESPAGLAGYGTAVVIRHPDNTYTLYAHLDQATVAEGQMVRAGQTVGRMGNSSNGQFSPMPGQDAAAWAREARARGYRSGPMVPHLHVEVRRRPDGGSPFPGRYPTSAADAQYNINPSDWLRSKGIVFTSRGGVSIAPGSEAAQSQASWQPLISASTSMAGLGVANAVADSGKAADAGKASGDIWAASPASPLVSAGVSPVEPGKFVPGGYEPVKFERDVRFGLTPMEWAAIGVGAVVLTGGGAFFAMRSRMQPNRRRRARAA